MSNGLIRAQLNIYQTGLIKNILMQHIAHINFFEPKPKLITFQKKINLEKNIYTYKTHFGSE